MRTLHWTLALLLGAALGAVPLGVPAANAAVSLVRTDIPLAAAPESVALGDLDGQNGKDIVVAMPSTGSVGVMLNNGDGTFAAMQPFSAGPACAGLAVDITLGDVTTPAPGNRLQPDGHLDAYVACTPYVVRLTGDGTGALGNPEAINLGLPQYLGSGTLDLLALMRRPDGNPVPLLVFQHAVGSFGRQLCLSYELDPSEPRLQPHAGAGAARRRRPQREQPRGASRRGSHLRGRGVNGDLRVRASGPPNHADHLGRQPAQGAR